MMETLNSNAFVASGYGHPVVGWASDIETYDRELIEEYFRTYYAPNNLVAAVVGDVDANEVFAVCQEYFGRIPRGPEPSMIRTREPQQTGEKRVVLEFDANPSLLIGWHCPAIGHPDCLALDVMTSILSSGRTSRFSRSIVDDKKLASRVRIGSSSSRYADLIVASATPMQPHTCEEVELAIYEEIEKLKSEPVTEWELQKIKNQLDAGFIRRLNSNMGIAWRLADNYAKTGDWRFLLTSYENLKKVTADDVMRVAREYFIPENRTVVTLVKTGVKGDEESLHSSEKATRNWENTE
jgi:predicted Zn-dependent peptidase